MKILAVSGSPRKNGNTETLLASFLKGAEEVGAEAKFVRLADIPFKNCKGCNACHKNGMCIIKDELTPLFDEILASDILVLASPIYSMTVTAEMKGFIDRGQFIWAQKCVLKSLIFDEEHLNTHLGIFFSTAGQDVPKLFDAAFPPMRAFFNDAGFPYRENILFPGMDTKLGGKTTPELREYAYARGKEIAEEMMRKIN